jgi:hypothetical protein
MSDHNAVRFSHLLGFAGIGSIVRAEDWLYTVIDTSKWPEHTFLPYVERVRMSLNLLSKELHEPPKGKLDRNNRVQGATVPGIRFPSWMRCRKCGLMHWKWWKQVPAWDTWPRCSACRTSLDQFPWVMIDTDGRMDDVPWHWLLHHDGPCKEDRCNPHLRLFDNRSAVSPASTSGAIARTSKRWTLSCHKCQCSARRDLDEKVFGRKRDAKQQNLDNVDERKTKSMFWHDQPWRSGNPTKDNSAAEVHIVDVSNPTLYAVPPCSALVIPPESRIVRGSVLDRLYCNRNLVDLIVNARNPTKSVIEHTSV